jgi:YD repeat-containing protein
MNNAFTKCALVFAGLLVVWEVSFAGTTTYKYDALGRVSSVTDGGAVIRYIYDAAGNRKDKIASGGVATTLALQSTAVERRGSVVLSATVGGTGSIGSVSFYENGTLLGIATVINGVATVELIGWTRGMHNIVVSYSGDLVNAANSISVPIKVVNLDWLPAVLEILMN